MNGAGSDPIGIPTTCLKMCFPIEKKQLSSRKEMASLTCFALNHYLAIFITSFKAKVSDLM